MLDLVTGPWPWWVAGPLIGTVVPFVYWYGGKKWGVSSSLRHLCAATVPAGIEYFRYDWKRRGGWHLAMVAGMVLGGFVGAKVLTRGDLVVGISEATVADLTALGITDFGGLLPADLFTWSALLTPAGIVVVFVGGALVGFGARWAGGCTSGHAVSGLANLSASSLVTVLGFFAGGLLSTWVILPLLLGGGGP